jgi:hypothetical protein
MNAQVCADQQHGAGAQGHAFPAPFGLDVNAVNARLGAIR